ncbi:MAG: fibronectin type III domain-containing protein, partial [Terriglobales bacterium]
RFPSCGAPPPTAPNPPSNLSATAASSSQINLAWSDNSDNEDGFRVERCTGNVAFCDANPGNFSQIAELPANSNAYNDSGLSASTTLSYRVRAFNGVGNSAYSNTDDATTDAPPPTAPSPPSNLSAAPASSSQINLAWSDNSDNEGGFRVERCTGNVAFCDANPGNFSQITELPANSNTYNDSGLSASTTFSYRVRAFNGVGNSPYSNSDDATTDAPPPPPPTIPNPPSSLTATAGSSGNSRFVNLGWADNSDNEASFIVERCQVNKNGACNFAVIATLAANSVAHTDNGVSRRKTYRYRVKARNAVGDSAYSNTAQVTTP